MSVEGHTVRISGQSVFPTHHFQFSFSKWSVLNGGISGIRIKPCFSPYSEAAVCADNGPAVEKNGALQCVVSVANPHDSLLTIIARGREGFQQQPIQPEPAPLWPIVC